MLVGATSGLGLVPDIQLPQLDEDYLAITPMDIMGANRLNVLGEYIPLLAAAKVSYIGEPLFALFGPTLDTVEVLSRQIEISYHQPEKLEKPRILTFKQDLGNYDQATSAVGLQRFESSFTSKRRKTEPGKPLKVTARTASDTIEISAPTQWPNLIKEAVAAATGYNKRKIIIHRQLYFAPHDEYWLQPAHMACIAAIAAIKSGLPVELTSFAQTVKIETTVKKTTWYDQNKQTVAELAEVQIDQGAYPLFSNELCKQMLAGLLPEYPLKGFRCTISIVSSPTQASNFFGDLGYCDALAASEIHSSRLGKKLEQSPYLWRQSLHSADSLRPQVIAWKSEQQPDGQLDKLAQKCFFNRKNASYQIHKSIQKKLSLLSSYARGIGIASGPGLCGFSSNCKGIQQQSVMLTLHTKGKVICNTSFLPVGHSANIWKQIIAKKLEVNENDISFTEDGPFMIDSGPSLLSVSSGRMPKNISLACEKIKSKRFLQALPISESADSKELAGKHLFQTNTWGALVIELQIDPVNLEPIISHIWGTFLTGQVSDKPSFTSKMKQTIITTLLEQGAKLALGNEFKIDLDINCDDKELTDSLSSGLRGIAIAAYAVALEQALSCQITELPIFSEEIVALMEEAKG